MAEKYYVYEHWRPDTNQCFYVGKGKRRRAWGMSHRNPAHRSIQSELSGKSLEVSVVIVRDALNETEALVLEKELISDARARGIGLVNILCGGGHQTGFVPSDEQRKRVSEALKNREFSLEHCRKISAAKKGRRFSPEHRAKLCEARKNKVSPRLGKCGQVHSMETRAAMRKSQQRRRLKERQDAHAVYGNGP